MATISRQEVIMPGGIELTKEAEGHLCLTSDTKLLSVACGTGELELYLGEKYGCQVTAVDLGKGFISMAQGKATDRDLEGAVSFEIGDGNALRFDSEAFDVVFCSGAICAFFDKGLQEFHRVLKPGGRAAIIEVIWTKEEVPKETEECWAEGTADILTIEGNCAAFAERGFNVLFSRAYHEPTWWDAYYEDRGASPDWIEERENYRRDQEYVALGLFVIEKA